MADFSGQSRGDSSVSTEASDQESVLSKKASRSDSPGAADTGGDGERLSTASSLSRDSFDEDDSDDDQSNKKDQSKKNFLFEIVTRITALGGYFFQPSVNKQQHLSDDGSFDFDSIHPDGSADSLFTNNSMSKISSRTISSNQPTVTVKPAGYEADPDNLSTGSIYSGSDSDGDSVSSRESSVTFTENPLLNPTRAAQIPTRAGAVVSLTAHTAAPFAQPQLTITVAPKSKGAGGASSTFDPHAEFDPITKIYQEFVKNYNAIHTPHSLTLSPNDNKTGWKFTIDSTHSVDVTYNRSQNSISMTLPPALLTNPALAQPFMACQLKAYPNPTVSVAMNCKTDDHIVQVKNTLALIFEGKTGLDFGSLNLSAIKVEALGIHKQDPFIAALKEFQQTGNEDNFNALKAAVGVNPSPGHSMR